jgi:hypothetical protein
MDPKGDELRDRLLAQQAPDPEKIAAYRKGVEAMIDQLHRERWWIGCSFAFLFSLGVVALFFGAFVFGVLGFYLAAMQGVELVDVLIPALGSILCLAGAIGLLWYFRRRGRTRDLLLEIKRLEMRVLELEQTQHSKGDR